MATGSAGGSRIITATLHSRHHHLDLGMSSEEAVYTPRWHEQLGPTLFEGLYNESDTTFYEAGVQWGLQRLVMRQWDI
ncbi:hypothetical protein BDZ89DRAFT_1079339 [Hymenopellis radicata]|nr:hypothetical protein BDZ89DRAFT_1079339 [Hymenopellis radicata]